MLVSKSCRLLVLTLVAGGCGSEVEVEARTDWVLGTFSNQYVGNRTIGPPSLGQYHFREDGTLAEIAITYCGENSEELLQQYKWSRAEDWLVISRSGLAQRLRRLV